MCPVWVESGFDPRRHGGHTRSVEGAATTHRELAPVILYLDFETRSKANLRAVGAYRYAEDPSTEVLLAAVAVDGAPVERLGRLEARARLPALIARAEY